jgi:hypothetical protein
VINEVLTHLLTRNLSQEKTIRIMQFLTSGISPGYREIAARWAYRDAAGQAGEIGS